MRVLSRSSPYALEDHVAFDDVVTCLPVVQEILQGVDDEAAFRRVRRSMLALPVVESPLGQDVFLEAAELYRTGRRTGFTIRSAVDCVIAVCALRHDLEVLHEERDFATLALFTNLRQRDLREA